MHHLPTPVLLLTGFLGSGKTTLVNRFLQLPKAQKLGVVVNEFGQIGVDKALMATDRILELSGGCICCATGNELWEAALSLHEQAEASQVIIETSGIANPALILQQYQALPTPMKNRLHLHSTACVIDVLHVEQVCQHHAEAKLQILSSNRLLLSKIDLATPEQLNHVHQFLDDLGATSERISLLPHAPASQVAQTLKWLFSSQEFSSKNPSYQPGPAHQQQLNAVSIMEEGYLLEEPLNRLLVDLAGKVWRAKGFVRLFNADSNRLAPNNSVSVLQLVGKCIELSPCSDEQAQSSPPGSTLVFIGEKLDEEWLKLRLSACRAPT